MHRKFGEHRTCSSGDMIADRQTHTHTHTDRQTRSSQYSALYGGGVTMALESTPIVEAACILCRIDTARSDGFDRSRHIVGSGRSEVWIGITGRTDISKLQLLKQLHSQVTRQRSDALTSSSVWRWVVFTARCYASAVLAMAVCLSVRLSVRHKSVFY